MTQAEGHGLPAAALSGVEVVKTSYYQPRLMNEKPGIWT